MSLCVLGRAQSLWRRQCKTCWIWCMTWARTQISSSTWCVWSSRSIRTPARRPTGRTWAMSPATWLLSGWWGCLQSLAQRKGPPLSWSRGLRRTCATEGVSWMLSSSHRGREKGRGTLRTAIRGLDEVSALISMKAWNPKIDLPWGHSRTWLVHHVILNDL